MAVAQQHAKIHADQDACHNHTDTDTTLSTPASSTLREPSMSLDSSRRNLHRSSAQNWSETSVFAGTTQLPRGEGHRPTSWLLLYCLSPTKNSCIFREQHKRPSCAVFRCPAPQHLQLRGGEAQCLEAADPQQGGVAKSERMPKLRFFDAFVVCPRHARFEALRSRGH